MKTLILCLALVLTSNSIFAREHQIHIYQESGLPADTAKQNDDVKLQVDGTNAYYQRVVKLDSTIKVSAIYIRSLQFMASKNFQQNYGYEEEGKLIFTTAQDLNVNDAFDDNETVDPYTVQFAITIDMKNSRYRYTIHNVVFYRPTETGNRRLTLYDMYLKEGGDSRRISKDAKKLVASFEKYITKLTDELHENIEQKSIIHSTKF